MRILQVITSLSVAGAEKLVTEVSIMLSERGHQVDVLTFRDVKSYLKKMLEDNGLKVYSLSQNSVYSFLNIFRLIPYLSKYDIIHSHNTACQYYLAIAKIISFSKTPIITTEHSTNNRRREYYGFKIIDSLIYRKYSHIISVSEDVTQNLRKHMIGNYPVSTISNGIDVSSFLNSTPICRTSSSNTSNDDIVITMVAAFRDPKDQNTLIKAMKLLPKNVKLWLAGDGDKKIDSEKMVCDLGLADRVSFLGVRNDIPSILKASDIIALSSHFEGLSLSSIEGMSVMRPFMASNVEGLRDIVSGAGILFEQGNESDFAQKVKELINNRDYYEKVAEKCLERAMEYDISRTVTGYENIYFNNLNNR